MKKIILMLLILNFINVHSFDSIKKKWSEEELQSFLESWDLTPLLFNEEYKNYTNKEKIQLGYNKYGYLFFVNFNLVSKHYLEYMKFSNLAKGFFGKEYLDQLENNIFTSFAEPYIRSIIKEDMLNLYYVIFTNEDGEFITTENPFRRSLQDRYVHLKNPKLYRKILFDTLASTFKIHLQVALKYLPNFVEKLRQKINNTDILNNNIPKFKVMGKIIDKRITEDKLPIIVIYLDAEYKKFEDRKKIMTQIIESLDELINDFCVQNGITKDELQFKNNESINVIPRYNTQIKNLIYIAGGNADDKIEAINLQKEYKLPNTVFTDDFVFFKGFEFYKKDYEEEKSKLIKELENRVKELEKEVSKLEKF